MISFQILKTSGKARRGQVTTAHGTFQTPAFMPVGTAGTVKAMFTKDVEATGAEILLGNTYHLMLRPTADRVERLGGLHKFMNWPHSILTDSGGFQVMSLSKLRKITEDGVRFQSHLDGSTHWLTPESSIRIQHQLDADISMALDQCIALPAPEKAVRKSTELSMRWAERSRAAFQQREGYGLFGIMQGGTNHDLRAFSAQELVKIGFEGYAIGGLAVGEGQEEMFRVLDYAPDMLPTDKPRYLMGVGKPSDIVGSVLRGVDMFDCVMPSRAGRTALAFTRQGTLNLRNACFQDDTAPLDDQCACPACQHYTRAYLHHLFRAGEMLGAMLLTYHNIYFYQDLMRDIRKAIEAGTYEDFAAEFFERRQQQKRPL